jgi:two-component system NtrC family sensor kinase
MLPADTPGRLVAMTRAACAATLLVVLIHPSGHGTRMLLHAAMLVGCTGLFVAAAVTTTRRAHGVHRPLFLALSALGALLLAGLLLDIGLAVFGRQPSPPTPGMWLVALGTGFALPVGLAVTAATGSRSVRAQAVLDTLLLAFVATMLVVVMGHYWTWPEFAAADSEGAALAHLLRAVPVVQLLLLAVVIAVRGERLGWQTCAGLALGTSGIALCTSLLGRLSLLDAAAAARLVDAIAAIVLLGFSTALRPGMPAQETVITPTGMTLPARLRRDLPAGHHTGLVIAATALTAFVVLYLGMRRDPSPVLAMLAAGFVALLATRAVHALRLQRREARLLARSIAAERELSATLEARVSVRTAELAEAQRVLQRMWTLGQQVTLELQPQRVLERFMEAVLDVGRSDAGALGLVVDEHRLRLAAAVNMGDDTVGLSVPIAYSAMGQVVRTGESWTDDDLARHPHLVFSPSVLSNFATRRGAAVVPVQRRGERIGALLLVTREPRRLSPAELARVESMTDMLSVALANAELVETLRQAEWRFRTLFRAAPDAVLTLLASGRVREANEAVRDVTGLDPVQIVGRVFADLAAPEDRGRLEAAIAGALAGKPTRLELRLARAGVGGVAPERPDAWRLLAIAASRLPEADPPTVLLIARDITAEREMRARLAETERLAAVGELVAGVAHEVNNPLSTISAYAQLMLRDGGVTGDQRESLEIIRAETVRASQVVKDLLAFARRSEPQREAVDLGPLLERTVRLHAYHLASGKLTVETEVPADLPAVHGDARQLQQVVLNLVTNAVQAMMPQGTGTLRLRARAERDRVVLDISDTGRGIAPQDRARIFEPFFTTKPEGEGTGLGLSVSYGIAAAHGGSLTLVDTSPAGTTFRVALPAAAAGDDAPLAASEAPLAARSPLAGIRLLFVDDEPALRSGMTQFGRLRGFTVLTAADGAAAMRSLREVSVDAIVCDLRMPGVDGPTFHAALDAERPGLARRTVFITGDMLGSAARGGIASRQPVLTKPFTFERLEATVAALLRDAPVPTEAH